MKKPLIAVALIAVLVIAALYGWQDREADTTSPLTLYGNVDIRQVALAFDGNGRIVELRAEEGERVKAGAVLATLDTRTLALQADQARFQIEAQQQSLLRLRNGTRPQEIAQARSRLAAAQAESAHAAQDLARLERLVATTQGRAVSAQDVDRARSALQVARARSEEQREALRLAESGPRAEDIAAAQAQLEALQAQLALLEHQIGLGELRAPDDAVVRSRLLEPGDMATSQRPVFALALIRPKWVRAYVGEADLGRLRPGMTAQVITDSHPGRPIEGRVGYISSVAEFTPKLVQTEELRTSLVYEVRVRVDDADDELRLGQPATVRLARGLVQ